ncbi:isoprenylcysteine carboxyl methyltransferase family protein [Acuticoccus sp. I52.16.1]|uniref:isoprenylcysteine carboxyl methyltransferase family protein n=1 Tax=Acuticoccus sp. I52.16.1 TaxID=2928472 RepID=UPI001FD59659|nr:isoprenylcysteine carboxylmethyltransferase family protein [Acuticoccus sp. I52.16.1]UOM34445.1 hypothetical protein MRB58_21955 [Acuticoccus sp. I52.16.1]
MPGPADGSAFFIAFVGLAVVFRLVTLAISIRNEAAMKAVGAVEHGAANSRAIALAHIGFYLAGLAEYLVRPAPFDWVSVTGLAIYAFGAVMLVVVIALLGRFWTVKLIIARDHDLVTHPLFRAVRHPNYYLNILPELVGYAVTLQAWVTLVVGLAIYMVPLTVRIRQEERVMRGTFARY